MYNYYIFPPSYDGASISELESNLKTLNVLIETESDVLDHFLYDASFWSVVLEDKNELVTAVFTSLQDEQFKRAILPRMLKRLTWCTTPFKDVNDLNANYTDYRNALWGIRFTDCALNHLSSIEQYRNYRNLSIENIGPNQLLLNKTTIFKQLVITKDAERQIIGYGTSDKYKQIISHLKMLNTYICTYWHSGEFSLDSLNSNSGIVASDESDTVKQKEHLRRHRCFNLPKLGTTYCYFHIKFGDIRIHFYPNKKNLKVYIAYIGKHLPL